MIHAASPLSIAVIVGCYLIFALQLAAQGKAAILKTEGGRAITALVVVFLLCAVSGYLTTIIPTPPVFREVLHALLAGASIWLVVSNQAGAVAAMFDDSDRTSE